MNRGKILLIDDEASFYEQMRVALAKYEVVHAADLKSAGIALYNDNFDLVLLDLKLDPELDDIYGGLEYIGKLRKKYPILPVIVLSKHTGYEEIMTAMRSGAADFFHKGIMVLDVWRNRIEQAIKVKQLSEKRHPFIGTSPGYTLLKEKLESWSQTDEHILISGGIGVGKTSAAYYFYSVGKRRYHDLRPLDLSLYAQEAEVEQIFEKMKSGVVLIKHIDRISSRAQAFLMHHIELQQNGGAKANMQFIGTTSKDMREAVHANEFRSDLYYALKQIEISPLRERKEDILPLLNYYLAENGHPSAEQCVSPEARRVLLNYAYPDNVSELKRVVSQMVQERQLRRETRIELSCLPQAVVFPDQADVDLPLHEFRLASTLTVLDFVDRALVQTYGQKGKAAKLLNLKPDDLRYMIIKYNREYPGLLHRYPTISNAYKLHD